MQKPSSLPVTQQLATITYTFLQRKVARQFIVPRNIVDVDISDTNAMTATVEIYGDEFSILHTMVLAGAITSYTVSLAQ